MAFVFIRRIEEAAESKQTRNSVRSAKKPTKQAKHRLFERPATNKTRGSAVKVESARRKLATGSGKSRMQPASVASRNPKHRTNHEQPQSDYDDDESSRPDGNGIDQSDKRIGSEGEENAVVPFRKRKRMVPDDDEDDDEDDEEPPTVHEVLKQRHLAVSDEVCCLF